MHWVEDEVCRVLKGLRRQDSRRAASPPPGAAGAPRAPLGTTCTHSALDATERGARLAPPLVCVWAALSLAAYVPVAAAGRVRQVGRAALKARPEARLILARAHGRESAALLG